MCSSCSAVTVHLLLATHLLTYSRTCLPTKACRADGFAHVPSFKWLVACLMALLRIESPHGADVGDQLVEVA